jgi:hypothetical protein
MSRLSLPDVQDNTFIRLTFCVWCTVLEKLIKKRLSGLYRLREKSLCK